MKEFRYQVGVTWMGNDGSGTSSKSFSRDLEIAAAGKPTIVGAAPSDFGGHDRSWSPEELLVGAVSQCHMLTYLFLCARNGIVVESYEDDATGTLVVEGAAGGHFREIALRPHVTISSGELDLAEKLHDDASAGCFIGRSVRAEITVQSTITMAEAVVSLQ
jgi:organic hydroperoxide reductase OsmC/OhrA